MIRLKFGITAASISIGLLSSPVFAAPDCNAYIHFINKQIASHLAVAGPRAVKNVSLDEWKHGRSDAGPPYCQLDT